MPAPPSRNEVFLTGRLSGEPVVRTLPSGDELTTWRLVVDRAAGAASRPGARTPTVDTIDCSAQKKTVQRAAIRWAAGDLLEVRGALRRRFWRAPQGLASRYEVDVADAKRLTRRSGTTA